MVINFCPIIPCQSLYKILKRDSLQRAANTEVVKKVADTSTGIPTYNRHYFKRGGSV